MRTTYFFKYTKGTYISCGERWWVKVRDGGGHNIQWKKKKKIGKNIDRVVFTEQNKKNNQKT